MSVFCQGRGGRGLALFGEAAADVCSLRYVSASRFEEPSVERLSTMLSCERWASWVQKMGKWPESFSRRRSFPPSIALSTNVTSLCVPRKEPCVTRYRFTWLRSTTQRKQTLLCLTLPARLGLQLELLRGCVAKQLILFFLRDTNEKRSNERSINNGRYVGRLQPET